MEDEEDLIKPPANKIGQEASPVPAPPQTSVRGRSFSASQPPIASRTILKRADDASTPPSAMNREARVFGAFPVRTRGDARTPDSAGSDGVIKHSDDEAHAENTLSPKRRNPLTVSAKTRDLIDFLSEGPPDSGPKVRNSFYIETAGCLSRIMAGQHERGFP
jgi:hypothetical protein